jgi:hypothetical protein
VEAESHVARLASELRESIEELAGEFLRDAPPFVIDEGGYAISVLANQECDNAAGGRMAQSVLEEVGEHTIETHGIGPDMHLSVQFDLELQLELVEVEDGLESRSNLPGPVYHIHAGLLRRVLLQPVHVRREHVEYGSDQRVFPRDLRAAHVNKPLGLVGQLLGGQEL